MAKQRQHTHFEQLKNKWVQRHQTLKTTLWNNHKESLAWLVKHSRNVAIGSASAAMLLSSPVAQLQGQSNSSQNHEFESSENLDKNVFLINDLANKVPTEVRPLTNVEEERITAILSERFGMKVAAELEGKRLNRSYGYIGAEQHLARYPGDTMMSHFDTTQQAQQFTSSGMAPGLGAWGYFTSSQGSMTEKDKAREKYYIAVQTFLSENFNERFAEYRDFYKYRKMLVVNPNNGRATVVVIGDAGPAEWTGKHLGGSPEVMRYLERVDGRQKGPVLYFFIDDPDDIIPLGPIEVK